MKTLHPFAKLVAVTAGTAISSSVASGAISIVNQVEGFLGSNKAQVTTTHNGTTQVSYNATGVDKLVVVIGTESGFAGHRVTGINVSFNGSPMILAVLENTIFDTTPPLPGDWDGGVAALFYLDNPFQGSAVFSVGATTSGGGLNGGHVSVIGLAGTLAGVGATSATWHTLTAAGSVSTNLTTTSAGSMVIAGLENSGMPSNAGNPGPTVASPFVMSNNGFWGTQWGSAASATMAVPTSGTTVAPTFTTNAGGNIHVIAAEFAPVPVPEPGAVALLGLAGLLAVRRRR